MKITVLLLSLALMLSALPFAGAEELGTWEQPKVLADYVLDLGVLDDFDEANGLSVSSRLMDTWAPGGCSACVAETDSGLIVGRNMDLSISNKPAYVMRVQGSYKAILLSYGENRGFDFAEAQNGITVDQRDTIPLCATDCLNEKGLYIEENMRHSDTCADGTSLFGFSSTNPGAEIRVCQCNLPYYLGTRCANIPEVLELIQTIDIYSMNGLYDYNLAYLLADAEGNYGVLEFAQGKFVWNEGAKAQANFYLSPEFAQHQLYGDGYGRYALLLENVSGVKSTGDMLSRMSRLNYSQMYYDLDVISYDHCEFDRRTDQVKTIPVDENGHVDFENGDTANCTAHWLTDESRRDEVEAAINRLHAELYGGKDMQQIRDAASLWFSIYSVAVDCSAKTMTVRFYENEADTFTFGFDW